MLAVTLKTPDILDGHHLVERVAHRVDEGPSRPLPAQQQVEAISPELQIKALLVWVSGHRAEPLGERQGVAAVAAEADLRAARHRVPSRVRLIDRRVVAAGPA